MSNTENNYKISNWLGEFADQGTEQAYRDFYTEAASRYLRIAMLVWAGILMLFALPDYFFHGTSPIFYQLLTMRVTSVAIMVSVYAYSYKKPEIATTGYVVTAVEIALFNGLFMFYFISVEYIVWMIGITQITLLALYIFIPNRVYLASLAAVYGIVGSLISIAMVTDVNLQAQVSLAFLFILPMAVGFTVAIRLQIAQRQHYALISTANTVNQQLEKEITRREQLESELKHLATTDSLTGLYNRREYERLFKLERERANRTGRPFCLCLTDLDHFKVVNDRFGHDIGDKVLIHIADLLRKTLRQTDIIGRFGGEEFILLLPDTELEKALELTNRLRESIASTPLLCDSEVIHMTATFGVALVRETDRSINDVIRRTDEALYKGKHEGRNRVVRSA